MTRVRVYRRFKYSIVSLQLCKEYLTALKLKTLFLLQIKY